MKLGALHLYLVIISFVLIISSIIKLFEGGGDVWKIMFMIGFFVNCIYVCLGVAYALRLEDE